MPLLQESIIIVVTGNRIAANFFFLRLVRFYSRCCRCHFSCCRAVLPRRRRRIRTGSYHPLVDRCGRGNGCRGTSDLDRFRAGNRWPAQNRLTVSRQVSLIFSGIVGLFQRPFQLVHQPIVELVQRIRAAGFRRRRTGTLARTLQRALRRPRGRSREMARSKGHGTVSRRCQKVWPWRGRQRWTLGFWTFRNLRTKPIVS